MDPLLFLADVPVEIEPVSGHDFLQTGKLTGNLVISASPRWFSFQNIAGFPMLKAEFRKRGNREFPGAYQRTGRSEQGNRGKGKRDRRNTSTLGSRSQFCKSEENENGSIAP